MQTELEAVVADKEQLLSSLQIEKDGLSKELEELRQELERHKAGTDMQTELAKAEAKFVKMKDAYGKLRSEHIELLRAVSDNCDCDCDCRRHRLSHQLFDSQKADVDKQMTALRNEQAEFSKSKQVI